MYDQMVCSFMHWLHWLNQWESFENKLCSYFPCFVGMNELLVKEVICMTKWFAQNLFCQKTSSQKKLPL